jgi:predicted O-linked N-acetylglucosamine transferase (SPINDLY family)
MTIDDTIQLAVAHHQAGRWAEAEGLYRQILAADPDHADALHLLGALACQRGQTDLALELIGKAIALHPAAAPYHHNLGETYRRAGHWEQAITSFRRAIALRPDDAEAHNSLGVALFETGRNDEAIAAHRRAIELQASHPWAHVNLGNALSAAGSSDEAIAACQRAIDLQPTLPEAHNSLGAVLQTTGRTDLAIAAYRRALELTPDYAEAHNNLGNALLDQGQLEEAIAAYGRAVERKPDLAEAHSNLIVALYETGRIDQGRLDAALACIDRARALRPAAAALHKMAARILEWEGKTAQARAALDQALASQPSDALRLRRALLLPVIYSSLDELHQERSGVEDELTRLAAADLSIDDPAEDVGVNTFYLPYQGTNDRDLLVRLATLYRKATPSLAFEAPHCRAAALRRPPQGPIKVGFVSRYFYRHTIGKLNLGLVRHLTRPDFSVTLLRFPGPDDELARAFEQSADHLVNLPRALENLRQRIAELQLDVLYYCDIGMDPWTYFLAHARLAPVQCVTWGHPITTGIPSLDYFISSRLLEGEAAAGHYSEELVTLDTINTFYYEPHLDRPVDDRVVPALGDAARLYVCPQSLFKIHPGFDTILAGILRGDPGGRVVLIEGSFAHWEELLAARFERSFPDVADRVVFLPRLSQDDFLHLLARADVLLDTTPFGGGSTSYEAFAFGTPIVTLPGPLLRGRITAACYRQMGVLDCIARTEDEYIQTALRLGMDPAWREHVRAEILSRKHLLYEDAAAVRQLEQFLRDAVERARSGTPSPA